MAKKSDRTVFQRSPGVWVNKRNAVDRASSLHTTQREAREASREMLRNSGGGELTTMSPKGPIVSKDTIPPGNDLYPPEDKEH